MKVAVLSGKGGAGKTMTAVNLAAAFGKAVYVDCDVEEPNGRLFFKPEIIQTQTVSKLLPSFNAERCIGCRECVSFCRFNALAFFKNKPILFEDVCHSCGGCKLVCPATAVDEKPHPVGQLEIGVSGDVTVITGVLNTGQVSGIPVIKAAQKEALTHDGLIVLDCPPGSSCPVMESVSCADYCILAAEPTAFGFHNFQMVHELVSLLKKPCGVVINKEYEPYSPLEEYCAKHHLPVLMRIPFRNEYARLCSQGEIIAAHDPDFQKQCLSLLHTIGGDAK